MAREGSYRGRFATTRWSVVLAAGRGGSAAAAGRALEELCSWYWAPLYSYARRRGYSSEDARDLTQAFFLKLLEKRDLAAADPGRGRFRTFLLSSMKNFLAGERRKEHALKRGGGVEVLGMDFDSAEEAYRLEPSDELDPERLYVRKWALGVLERAMGELKRRYVEEGKGELFEALKGVIDGEQERLPYAELSQRLGMSEGALRTAASRLKSRWRRRLRELVAETVESEGEVRDEIRSLVGSVGGDV